MPRSKICWPASIASARRPPLELQRTDELRADAEKYRERLAAELRDFERQREAEWQAARDQIDDELREVRGQLRRLRDEFRSVSVSRQWMEEAEKRLQETQGQVQARSARAAAPRSARWRLPSPPPQTAGAAPAPGRRTVLVRSVGLSGEILSIDEDEGTAEVQVGGFRMQADLAELRRETKSERKADEPQRAEPQRAQPAAAARCRR